MQQKCPDKTPPVVSTRLMYQAIVCVSLAMSILSCFLYDRFFATKIAVFDFASYLLKIKEAMATGKMSEEELLNKIREVKNMTDSVSDSVPRNVIVISRDAVLGKPANVRILEIDKNPAD